MSWELGALIETPGAYQRYLFHHLTRTTDTRPLFSSSLGVSWGELTSSKLLAPSYEAAVKRALITDP